MSTATVPTAQAPLWQGVAGPYVLVTPGILLVLGVFFQSVDTFLAKEAFDLIVNQTGAISTLIAVTVASIGALAAIATGIAVRSRHHVAAIVTGVLWLGIGTAMALIRYNTASITGETVLGDPSVAVRDEVTAVLMMLLYLAAGTDIIYSITKLWNPLYRTVRSARRRMRRLQHQLNRLEPRYTRTRLALDRFPHHRNQIHSQHASTHRKISDYEAELKARARLLIGQHLGDPAHTALYRGEPWPAARDKPNRER